MRLPTRRLLKQRLRFLPAPLEEVGHAENLHRLLPRGRSRFLPLQGGRQVLGRLAKVAQSIVGKAEEVMRFRTVRQSLWPRPECFDHSVEVALGEERIGPPQITRVLGDIR